MCWISWRTTARGGTTCARWRIGCLRQARCLNELARLQLGRLYSREFSSMRVALAQINPRVGDLAGNLKKHLERVREAKAAGAEVVLFPELSVVGYPPKDLLLK